MRIFGLLAVIITGALLLYATADLPTWGDPGSPANASPISQYYITQIETDTHVPNMVTAVLADYRSYDTMFETVVIFAAGIAIIGVLRGIPVTRKSLGSRGVQKDCIIQVTCRLLIPVIQVFALYVLAHGHHSPGGGFQGGVILGASFILLALSRDLDLALKRLSEKRFLILSASGILLYAGVGLTAELLGGNFLDYSILHKITLYDPIMARYWSMLWVEIGVAMTVCAIMFAIYANLSSRGSLKEGL